jgi:hypothetical protein
MLAAREQRRVGDVDRQIQREHFARANRRRCRNHALWSQQVDRADFVVVAEHAPSRARRRACPHRQLVVAGELWRMGHGVPHGARRPGRNLTDFSHRCALHPPGRALDIDGCAGGGRHDLSNRVCNRPRGFLRRWLRSLDRDRALDDLGCGLFSLDRFGSDFAGLRRRFHCFLFGLGHGRILLNRSSATASSLNRPPANGKSAVCDPQIPLIQP